MKPVSLNLNNKSIEFFKNNFYWYDEKNLNECNDNWFWPVIFIVGITYSIFLLFQLDINNVLLNKPIFDKDKEKLNDRNLKNMIDLEHKKIKHNMNCILTPHISGVTYESNVRVSDFIVDKLTNFFN